MSIKKILVKPITGGANNASSINLIEDVETMIPGLKINNKQVYQKYCTTDSQINSTLLICDYASLSGIAVNQNGDYKGVPWFYYLITSQKIVCYNIDTGQVLNSGFQTTGHKLVLTYTKK